MKLQRSVIILAAAVVVIGGGAAGYMAWKQYEASQLPAGIVSINGRVEATQVDISTKIPGRVIEIVPHEGDIVSPGEVVARIDTSETDAQLHQAQASAELARQTLVNPSGRRRKRRGPAGVRQRGVATHGDARRQGLVHPRTPRPAQRATEERRCGAQGGPVAGRRSPRGCQDRRRQGRRAAGGGRQFDDQVAGPRPGAVSPCRAGGGASARRQDRDGDRSCGRLHDRIPSRSAGWAAQSRG